MLDERTGNMWMCDGCWMGEQVTGGCVMGNR